MKEDSPRKGLIFETIEQLLLDEGLVSVTYAKISEKCHLHTNTITYYFDNKEDMMVQFFQYIVQRDKSRTPEFYTRIPQGMDPVEAFCRLVDHILDAGRLMSRTRRLLNLYLLPSADISPRVRLFLSGVHNGSTEDEYQAVQVYRRAGILEESRIRQAFADMSFCSAGYSLICFFGVKCLDQDLALQGAKERLKKAFLKDGLYPPPAGPPEER